MQPHGFQYDLAIVGMGPAGATLARLLGGRMRVAVVDQKNLARPEAGFHKPCGGLLAPDAQKALSRFALTLPKEVLVSPQIFSVKTIDVTSGLVRHYQRFYLNMDRHRFDLWMAGQARGRADIFAPARCCGLGRLGEGFEVRCRMEGEERLLTARYLVGADGASSLVRRTFFHTPIRQYLSIQQWFAMEGEEPFYSSIFDETVTDCYAWSDCKDGCLIFGAALPKQGARERFERLKRRVEPFGFDLSHPVKTEACLVSRPGSPRQFALCDAGVFLIGEAAGFISPSSLEGISYGIRSAEALAKALESGDPERAYRRATWAIRRDLTGKLLKVPFMYWPRLRRLVMASGLLSVPVEKQQSK